MKNSEHNSLVKQHLSLTVTIVIDVESKEHSQAGAIAGAMEKLNQIVEPTLATRYSWDKAWVGALEVTTIRTAKLPLRELGPDPEEPAKPDQAPEPQDI